MVSSRVERGIGCVMQAMTPQWNRGAQLGVTIHAES